MGSVSWTNSKVYAALSRERIETAPEYVGSAAITREYENRLYFHYGRPPYWLHQTQAAENAASSRPRSGKSQSAVWSGILAGCARSKPPSAGWIHARLESVATRKKKSVRGAAHCCAVGAILYRLSRSRGSRASIAIARDGRFAVGSLGLA